MPISLKIAAFFGDSQESHLNLFLKRNDFYVSTTILFASLVYYLSYASYGFDEQNWGLIVDSAGKILQGKVVYRDFASGYTPGIYLWTALFFKLLGASIHSATIAWSIIRAFNCVLIYRIGIKIAPHRLALLLPVYLWLEPGILAKSFFVFFILADLLVLLRLLSANSRFFYFLSGIVAGLTFSFRIDLFGYFVITVVFIELLKSRWSLKEGLIVSEIVNSLKNLFVFFTGIITFFLPPALYLLLNSAFDEFLSQFMVVVATAQLGWFASRPLIKEIFLWTKWDFVHYMILIIPVVIYSLTFIALVSDLIAGKFMEKDKKLSVILLYGTMTLSQIITATGVGRFFVIAPPVLISSMYLVSRRCANNGLHNKKVRVVYTAVLSAANLLFLALIIGNCFTSVSNESFFKWYTNSTLFSAPGINVYTTEKTAKDIKKIINHIENETAKDGYVFILPQQLGGLYYLMTGRRNPIKYEYTEQYEHSEEKQLEVISVLEDKKVKLAIVRIPKYDLSRYRAPVVLKYIFERYRITDRIKGRKLFDKLIFVRKDSG